jgi:dTDP-4-amino-4,6-dideoxygalactose transaminase
MIPKYDPTYTYKDLFTAWQKCSQGEPEKELCAHLKALYGVQHAFLFNSARIALFALLKAYGRPGGVLMPAYTCIVVPEAVEQAGYKPQFADIDLHCLNVTRDTLQKSLTAETRVVLATHLFGIPCALEVVEQFGRDNGLLVIEDAAPALGAEVAGKPICSIGDASIISFQATKVISGEDGGALLTNNHELAEKVERLLGSAQAPKAKWMFFLKGLGRKFALNPVIYPLVQSVYHLMGKELMYEIVEPARMEEKDFFIGCSPFSSALILVQFDRLAENLSRRRQLAQIYINELSHHPHISFPAFCEGDSPAWIQFPVMVKDKGHFFRYMQLCGIDMSWTYRYSCADSYGDKTCPEAKKAAQTVLGFPTYPSLKDKEAYHICDVANRYAGVN